MSPPITFVLAPFAQPDFADARAAGRLVGPSTAVIRSSDVVESAPEPVPFDTLRPSAPLLTIATAVGIVLMLLVAGYGWARAAFLDPTNALALSPAFGVAALILAGLVFERARVALTGAGPPVISAVAAAGGYALWWGRRRRLLRRVREREPVAQAPA